MDTFKKTLPQIDTTSPIQFSPSLSKRCVGTGRVISRRDVSLLAAVARCNGNSLLHICRAFRLVSDPFINSDQRTVAVTVLVCVKDDNANTNNGYS